MHDTVILALAAGAGMLLAASFFGGLWWTVRRGLASAQPALWFLGSLLLRTSVILAGFYWVAGDHWERLLACLLGFVSVRFVMTRLAGPPVQPLNIPKTEIGHAL